MINNLDNKECIKLVKKSYYYGEEILKSNDYLWLLSYSEITTSKISDNMEIKDEGKIYKYYEDITAGSEDEKDQVAPWWLRSINYTGFAGEGLIAGGKGSIGGRFAGWDDNVVPGFCI